MHCAIQANARAALRCGLSCSSRRSLSHFRVVEHLVPCSYTTTYPGAVTTGGQPCLKLAVKQYVPIEDNASSAEANGLTIIGGHANGFPKEIYEPFWDDLYEQLTSRGSTVRSIWIADVAQQGQSGVLNQAALGNDPNWWDHARDLLFLINQKQSQMSHPLVGIGHSMGGSILAALSLLHPRLIESLVLIDPVIQVENPSKQFAPATAYRRDRWPSREEARAALLRSKFYQSWDSRIFEQWMTYGIADANRGQKTTADQHPAEADVTLTTTKAQELFHYLRPKYKLDPAYTGLSTASDTLYDYVYPDFAGEDIDPTYPFYRPEPAEIYRDLDRLRPSVHYIFGADSPLSTEKSKAGKMENTGTGHGGSGGHAKNRVHSTTLQTGHLVPFEKPVECARVAARWIDDERRRWLRVRKEWEGVWDRTGTQEVDDMWREKMPKPARPVQKGT